MISSPLLSSHLHGDTKHHRPRRPHPGSYRWTDGNYYHGNFPFTKQSCWYPDFFPSYGSTSFDEMEDPVKAKVSGKRLKGRKEMAREKYRGRRCNGCGKYGQSHDRRNCHMLQNQSENVDQDTFDDMNSSSSQMPPKRLRFRYKFLKKFSRPPRVSALSRSFPYKQ